VDERFLTDLFVKGLPNKDLKRHVHMSHPRTLALAVDAAIAWEAFEEPDTSRGDRPRKPRDIPVTAVQPAKPLPKEVKAADRVESSDSLRSTLDSMAKALAGLEERLQKMEQTSTVARQRPAGVRTKLADLECFFCHEVGHISRNCLKRAQAGQANSQTAQAEPLNG
jgi:hypothetical protein